VRQAEQVWTDAEREEFVNFIAGKPEAGDLIPETGGVRKVRWGRGGSGKRGGARVIYFHPRRQVRQIRGLGISTSRHQIMLTSKLGAGLRLRMIHDCSEVLTQIGRCGCRAAHASIRRRHCWATLLKRK
jgi:hypothetical protein